MQEIGLRAVINLSQFNKGAKQYNKSITGMNKETSSFSSSATGSLSKLGGSIVSIGATAAKVAAGGVAVLGGALATFAIGGIKQATSLDQQMADIASVMGKTKDAVTPLKQEILDLSLDPQLRVNATEAATAVELLARNGLEMTAIMDGAAKSTVALANATRADFGVAADIATDVMSIFNIEAKDMGRAIDGITGVTTNSKLTIDDYGLALASVGAIGQGMGLSLEDMNTVLAATASSFSSGRVAGTSLKVLLQRLAKPTDEMQQAMDKYGISLFDSEGNMRSMADIANQLNGVFQGTATITETVGGATAEQAKLAQNAASKIDDLQKSIANNQAQLQLYNDELQLQIQYYGEGSPKVRQREIQIQKLTDTIGKQTRELGKYEDAVYAVENSQAKQISKTVELTEAEKANLAAVLGGADGARQIIALSKLTGDEFDALSSKVNAEGQALRAAATRVDSLQGAWDIFKSVIQAVQIQVGDKFLPVLRQVTVGVTDLATKYGPKLIDFFGNIAGTITGLVTKFGYLVDLFKSGGLDALLHGGTIGEIGWGGIQVEGLIGMMSSLWNDTILPTLISWGNMFWDWITDIALPIASEKMMQVVTFINQWLTDNWPSISATLTSWGNMFWDWINATALPIMGEKLLAVVSAISQWLTDNWPTINTALTEWGNMFWDWIIVASGNISTKVGELLSAFVAWIISPEAGQAISDAGAIWGQKLGEGMELLFSKDGATIVLNMIATLAKGIVGAIAGIIAIGSQFVAGVLEGILNAITGGNFQADTVATMGKTWRGIADNLMTILDNIGWDMVWGIIQGIASAQQDLNTAIYELFMSAIENLKSFLGISSPSTLFAGFGIDMIQGLINGILSMGGQLTQTIGGLLGNLFGGGTEGQAETPSVDTTMLLAGLTDYTEQLAITGEAVTAFYENITSQTIAFLEGAWLTLETRFNNFIMIIIPQTQQAYTTAFQQMINITQVLIGVVQQLVNIIASIGTVARQSVNEAKEAFKDFGDSIEEAAESITSELLPALRELNSLLQETVDKSSAASGNIDAIGAKSGIGLSDGAGLKRGIGFANGLGLGYKIPAGYPNDSFGPLYVQSGEEMLVTPRGTSIESLVFSRLSSLLSGSVRGGSVQGGKSVQVNFNAPISITSGMDWDTFQAGVKRTVAGAF